MTGFYPARDGHPSMFALDNAVAVEMSNLDKSTTSRRPHKPASPDSSAKPDSLANGRFPCVSLLFWPLRSS